MFRNLQPAILAAVLGLCACSSPAAPIAFEDQGKPKVLRCTLRPNGQYLYASNYITAFPATVQAGSPAEVTRYATDQVDLKINKIDYQMRPITVPFTTDPAIFMKKFFVSSPEELGLAKVEESRRKNIENGIWQLGMTKEEVYAALGPPNWIDNGIDATNLPLDQIMDRNRWEYREHDIMLPIWPMKIVLLFADGKLQSTFH
jgi:hypothetical protein